MSFAIALTLNRGGAGGKNGMRIGALESESADSSKCHTGRRADSLATLTGQVKRQLALLVGNQDVFHQGIHLVAQATVSKSMHRSRWTWYKTVFSMKMIAALTKSSNNNDLLHP